MSGQDERPRGGAKHEAVAGDRERPFAIAGIGASAGGIEALQKLFRAMPTDSGLAFVVVQHLDPKRESHLVEILARDTAIPVAAVEDGLRLAPNHVYMILPDRELTITDGVLHLEPMTGARGHRRPVDSFLISLAQDRAERALGVILSGTGSDGSAGIRAIKAAGGLTIAQDPQTASHAGMPRHAMATGVVDEVLAPEAMPDVLLRYARALETGPWPAVEEDRADLEPAINRILAFLRARTGHDFRPYKQGTLLRRIHRRVALRSAGQLAGYEEILRGDPEEAGLLTRDLLINVSDFFRDPEAWQALEEHVIAPLVRAREDGGTIRVWVPACANGEEAYSIGMLLLEQAQAHNRLLDINIFASDPGDTNLAIARRGLYPAIIERHVSNERLRRFFEHRDDAFQVRKELRDLVTFASHNLLQDPPFFRIDLVSCRNFLIYVEDDAQEKILRLFHFALNEGGHLFLGNAETIGRHGDLFEAVSAKWRIYRRIGPTRHDLIDFPITVTPRQRKTPEPRPTAHRPSTSQQVQAAQRALAERFAPPSVLIDRNARILYFHGRTEDYLTQPPGEPTRELMALAREELRAALRSALQTALREHREVTTSAALGPGDTARKVSVSVSPLRGGSPEDLLVVSFNDELVPGRREPAAPPPSAVGAPQGEAGSAYEDDLTRVQQELSRTIEELETSNQELKASNEETTAMNEELQTSNEELETSKEELQSLNEELSTVNSQLQRKVEDLEATTNDLANLLSSTDVATVFVDREVRIRWFTPAIGKLVDILESDVGRPFGQLATKFEDPDLRRDAEAVLDDLVPKEAEVHVAQGDRWYLRRILPYRTRDDPIEGVVITFTDITTPKRDEESLRAAHHHLHAIFDAVRHPLLVLGPDLRVRSANASFYDAFGADPDDTEGVLIYDLGDGHWEIPELRRRLSEVLPRDKTFDDYEVEQDFVGLGRRTVLLSARQIDELEMILLSIEDVTERKRWEAEQQMLLGELAHRVKNTLATVRAIASHTARSAPDMPTFERAFGERLRALDMVHTLLIDGQWQSVRLHAVLALPLEVYEGQDGARVRITGEDFALTPKTALTMSMAVNELATNAAKYGALSAPSGRVEITTDLTRSDLGQVVLIRWSERGGPRVEPPSDPGFGLSLVERSIGHELDGEARVDFDPGGVRCEILIPYSPDHVQTD